jgi:hypothetical protein
VDRNHVVHRKALEFHRAQDLIYGRCTFGRCKSDLESMDYAELVQHSVRRIISCSS